MTTIQSVQQSFRALHARPTRSRGAVTGLTLFLATTVFELQTFAKDFYVIPFAAPSGEGSKERPWAGIAAIEWTTLKAGDTLWIEAGDYRPEELKIVNTPAGIHVRISPDASSPAVFAGGRLYAFNGSVLDGLKDGNPFIRIEGTSSFASGHGLVIQASSGSTVRGLEVDRSSHFNGDTRQMHGIHVNGYVEKFVIEDCFIHDTSGDGININTSIVPNPGTFDNFVIRGNRIFRVGDDGVQTSHGSITIRGNFIDNGGQQPLFFSHPDGIQINPDRRDVIIDANHIIGFNQNIFVEWATGNIILTNNIVASRATAGTDRGMNISARNASGFDGVWILANNLFFGFTSFFAINGGTTVTPISRLFVGNNIFLNCKQLISPGSLALDASNVFWDSPTARFYDSNGNEVAVPRDRGSDLAWNVDPSISYLTGQDYTIHAGSPLVDSGKDYSDYFTGDFTGRTQRPVGRAWDIGPIEFHVSNERQLPSPPSNLSIGNIE